MSRNTLNINRCMASGILFLILVMSPVGCRSQNKTDRSHSTIGWLPVHYEGRVITKVGDYKLPYPVKLPKNLRPLDNKALVGIIVKSHDIDNSNKGLFSSIVYLFFNPKQEKEARSWAQSLKDYKLWITDKDIRSKVSYKYSPYPNGWGYLLTARTIHGDIAYVFSNKPSYIDKEDLKDTTDLPKDVILFDRAMWKKGSPVIGVKRLISLWIIQRKSL